VGLVWASRGEGFEQGVTSGSPKIFEFGGLGALYGSTVYAFMCHHSLPSIITPIKNKQSLSTLFLFDYVCLYRSSPPCMS
jgi:hypothetical protein